MLGASGAMLQAGESAAGAVAGSVGASSVEGAQAATSGGGVSAIMGEIGDEDCKGRAGDSGGDELGSGGDRGFLGGGSGGNRWPRQETLALLKIRSDMDVVFRDSSLKGPLWEEVARKMADLGYHRSAKKCKEKFENVYKYHKRTKEGRAAKSDGKTYRFFDQLQALETHSMLPPPPALPPPPRPPPPVHAAVPISMAMPPPIQPPSVITTVPAHITVTSTNPVPVSISNVGQQSQPSVQPAIPATISHIPQPQQVTMQNVNAVSFPSSPSDTPSSSSTSSTSSDEEIHGVRRKRKRKWKDFFERLMKRVIGKQEDLQRKFLEAIEKREQDRMVREEAWKVQEMARLNREHEILVQERSMAAAKDAALISFLQKLSNQQQIPIPIPPPVIQPVSQPHPQPRIQTPIQTPPPAPVQLPQVQELKTSNAAAIVQVPAATQQLEVSPVPTRTNNGDPSGSYSPATASSSRWPKTEVEALINLRTILDQKYQENGPKGPLWEEISSEMKKLGYNRNAKRCKEKWENINKYFKKVKESNKKRPEDSKTCPYFHQLDALYRQKNKVDQGFGGYAAAKSHQPAAIAPVAVGVEAMAAPIMVQPEQQWPLQTDHNMEQDRDDEDDDEDEEEDEDEQGEGYEIVANSNNATSMGGAAAATAASS